MNESRDEAAGRRRWRAETAERLLDGTDAGDGDPRTAGLARLLATAAQPLPGRPEDERAVLDAFRAAARARAATGDTAGQGADRAGQGALGQPGPSGAGTDPRRFGRRRRSVKVLIGGAVAAFALSGVAFAAQTGVLPHPFRLHHSDRHVPGTPSGSSPASASGTTPGGSQAPTSSAAPGSSGPSSAASSPATAPGSSGAHGHDPAGPKGLCQAYVNASAKGKALAPNTEERLAADAGGEGRIAAYCAGLTGAKTPAPHASSQPPSATPDAVQVPEPATTTPEALRPTSAHSTPPHDK